MNGNNGKRLAREVKLGQYEFPALAAATVAARRIKALGHLARGEVAAAERLLREDVGEIERWMRYAQMVTDYRYAGEIVLAEQRRERAIRGRAGGDRGGRGAGAVVPAGKPRRRKV